MELKKRILVASLNWGLGHATRCIPLINALIDHNFMPVLASDGAALKILKQEFPHLETVELPSYNITYPKKAKNFKTKLLMDSPKMLLTIKAEKNLVRDLVTNNLIDGIISDNRLGVFNENIPSVFITHQLKVLSGSTSWFSSKLHQKFIKKFDECWVPDVEAEPSLSGKLGHLDKTNLKIKYIGPLSRLEKEKSSMVYDLMVLLSGPEPQRTMLENILFKELNDYKGKVLFIKGVVEDKQIKLKQGSVTIYNFMNSKALQRAINQSKVVISRSGYTTIMDLAKLEKKAFFIPTPGQYEQEYLADRLKKLKLAPSCSQDDFKIEKLDTINLYSGLQAFNHENNYKNLFSLFQSERKFTSNT